ncbi:restriction endonuclease [Puteibacter caeruleilacunae]|nr:restriction endonuclease [Puteibacter caeruleilacunae]
MAIPDYQSMMLPMLEAMTDGQQYRLADLREILAIRYNITPEQRRELLPSGTTRVFDNRVGWAKTYLTKAGLLTSPKRGFVAISERGREALTENLEIINNAYLKQFKEFRDFLSPNGNSKSKDELESVQESKTPLELLEAAHKDLQQKLASELLDYVSKMDPYKFESLVLELLKAMGYGEYREEAALVTKKSGDGGIDGIINEDRLGLDKIYIQAKRWTGNVTISAVRDFAGTLLGLNAQKGVFITTSDYPKTAHDYCEKIDRTIVLINGTRLAQLMIEYGIGVSTRKTFTVKELDGDYFEG